MRTPGIPDPALQVQNLYLCQVGPGEKKAQATRELEAPHAPRDHSQRGLRCGRSLHARILSRRPSAGAGRPAALTFGGALFFIQRKTKFGDDKPASMWFLRPFTTGFTRFVRPPPDLTRTQNLHSARRRTSGGRSRLRGLDAHTGFLAERDFPLSSVPIFRLL